MHTSVLLDEAVDALVVDPHGCYVDCTYGRGGHSSAILARLSERGRLLAIDRDPDAVRDARARLADDSRFAIEHSAFSGLAALVDARGWTGRVSGVLLDLGVSSPQLDSAERGFSFLRDGELDMRMNTSEGQSAAEWLASAKEEDIAQVLRDYGEEKFARRMARAIVARRRESPITRTLDLAEIVSRAHPAWERGKHPATRAFQAIRIKVNDELGEIERVLPSAVGVLGKGGRLVVISFHSLEDRLVKRFMRDEERGPVLPRHLPVTESQRGCRLRTVGKARRPGEEEVAENPRARSAVLRVAERIA